MPTEPSAKDSPKMLPKSTLSTSLLTVSNKVVHVHVQTIPT